jgi:hypothetical protein
MLTSSQVNTVLELIDRQVIFFAGSTLGPGVLSDQDKETLTKYGVNHETIYSEDKDPVLLNFHLGILSNILSDEKAKSLSYDQLTKYIKSGQYIPLNERELATIDSIRMQSLSDIKANRGKIFQDINSVVAKQFSSARADQEDFIRTRISNSNAERSARKNIARDIAKLTGDWSRNFDKSVQYISHTALNEGRSAIIQRRYEDNESAKVYFQVQLDACPHCVKHYLTNGSGSEPIIFSLKELQANGSNIGRKASEWLPTIHALHVHCRCLLTEFIPGTEWNGEKFVFPKGQSYKSEINRPKIRIVFNGEEHYV